MALLSSASLAEKVDFAHSLFDFGLDGDLNLAEVTVLLRTVLLAGAKVKLRFGGNIYIYIYIFDN